MPLRGSTTAVFLPPVTAGGPADVWTATHPAYRQQAGETQGKLAPCDDGTAYATLLTMHTATNSTQISKRICGSVIKRHE